MTVSSKSLKLFGFLKQLTEVTSYHGKLEFSSKSLILKLLTNLPNFPPKGGIRGW